MGDSRASACAHLTLPSLRDGSLPPPKWRRGSRLGIEFVGADRLILLLRGVVRDGLVGYRAEPYCRVRISCR